MLDPIAGQPVFIETEPLVSLARSCEPTPHKGTQPFAVESRKRLVKFLERRDGLRIEPAALETVLLDDQNSALMSVLAAAEAARAARHPEALERSSQPQELIEGRLYF